MGGKICLTSPLALENYLVVENLDCLGDDAAGNDGVGSGNGGDDVASHGLHLEPRRKRLLFSAFLVDCSLRLPGS